MQGDALEAARARLAPACLFRRQARNSGLPPLVRIAARQKAWTEGDRVGLQRFGGLVDQGFHGEGRIGMADGP